MDHNRTPGVSPSTGTSCAVGAHSGSADEDAVLMVQFQQGNEDAYVELYRRYRDRIVNFSRRLLGNAAEGEEAAQDIFLKLYRARQSYTPSSRFSTFLYHVATNHCLNIKGKADRRLRDTLGVDVEQQVHARDKDPEYDAHRAQTRRHLTRALAALPARQSAALVLCHHEGMSYREAAEILAVSESSVKSLIHRARARLLQLLGPILQRDTNATGLSAVACGGTRDGGGVQRRGVSQRGGVP